MKKILLKGFAVLAMCAAIVACANVTAKADPYDCLKGNHAFVRDYTRIPATCTAPGCNVYYCTTCLYGIEKYDIPALGHKMDKGHIIVAPTATTDGYLIYRCEHCQLYMGDQVIKANGINYAPDYTNPVNTYVANPLEAVPTYFDTNMLAICYIPYHSVITVNGAIVNYNAYGAQPLAAFLQAPGKYTIKVIPNTNEIHAAQNGKTFTVTVPKTAGKPVTVK